MTSAISLKFGVQALLLGDGESEEAFTAPCGITSLSRTSNITTNTTEEPDCDDVDAPVWLAVDEVSRQWLITGSGLLSRQALPTWRDWDYEGGPKNVRWYTNLTAPQGGGYFWGPALLTTFEEQGQRGQRWQVNFGVTFDGKPTRVAAV